MLQLLQSSAYTESRTLQLLVPPASGQAWGAQGAGRGQNQGSWPSLAKGIFRATWHCVEQWNWGDLARGAAIARRLTGHQSAVVSNGVVC